MKSILNYLVDNKENIIQWLVLIGFFIMMLLISLYNTNHAKTSMKNKRKYNVGILSRSSKSKSGSYIHYIYTYKGKTYEGQVSGRLDPDKIGERRLIIFSLETNEKFLLPYVINDCINDPYNGWDKIPYNISEKDILKYLN